VRIVDMSNHAQEAFNCAVNILAVEHLIKQNRPFTYGAWIEKLDVLDEADLERLQIGLELNMHMRNLGEMITQGDYAHQKEYLFEFLKKEKYQ